MREARQQRGEVDFTVFNRIHVPVALLSMGLLVPLIILGLRRERFAAFGTLAATIAVALLANAFVCGVLSNPHDRYGARLAWLPPLLMLLVAWRLNDEQRQKAPARRRPAIAAIDAGS
jgi:hypothetical protein